jgi:hypothetical protein
MFFRDKSSKEISERSVQLAAQLEQVRGAIRTSETMAAEAVAQGVDADFAAVGTLKVKAAAMESAGAILQSEKAAAEKRERLADAKAKRELGQSKRAEAAAVAGRCTKLLEKLGELEGVEYDATILSAQRGGSWMRDLTISERIPEHLRSPLEAGAPDFSRGWYAKTRERILIDEACELEDAADVVDAAEGAEVQVG